MEKLVIISESSVAREVFGDQDSKLKLIEKEFSVSINVRPQGLAVKGAKDKVYSAVRFIEKVIKLAKEGVFLTKEEIANYINSGILLPSDKEHSRIKVFSKKKFIAPKTEGQKRYIEAIKTYDITFAIGPAGTGKTYLAMAMAVNYLAQGKVSRIILTRPAIEAGESLGFLPGDMHDKLSPYLRPLYDAIYDMMDAEAIENNLETGIIEIAPLAYMRGRTLNNAFIILDEAQNCTSEQLKMFLTRLGFNSKTVITGDITQSDLPGGEPKGLAEAVKILKPITGIKFVNLTNRDVLRHPLIQKIVEAYESFYQKEKA